MDITYVCEFNVFIINLAQTRTRNELYGVPDSGLLLQLDREVIGPCPDRDRTLLWNCASGTTT